MQPLPPPPPPPPPPAAPPPPVPPAFTATPAPPPAQRSDPYPVDGRGPSIGLLAKVGRWIRLQLGVGNLLESRAKALVLFLLLTGPWTVAKFVVIPAVASGSVDALAEAYGVDIAVGDWGAHVTDLSATAKDIVLRVDGPFDQQELLVAKELEVDLSLWSRLRGSTWTRSLTLRDAKLYLERTASGGWNWEELTARGGGLDGYGDEAASTIALEDREPEFAIPRLRIDGLSLQWVETERGTTGDGVTREIKSSLYLDDMSLVADNVVGFVDPRPRASRLLLEARTGSGLVSFNGKGNLFHWAQNVLDAGPSSTGPAWAPSLEATISLDGVGAGVLARLTPQAALLPARGTMSGQLLLDVEQHQLQCAADLDLRDVTFTLNRDSPFYARHAQQLGQEVASFRADGPTRFDCGGVLAGDFRPFHAFQSLVTRKAVDSAPKLVRAVATVDHARYADTEVEPELRRTVASLTRDLDPATAEWVGLALDLGVDQQLSRNLPGGRAGGFFGRIGRAFGR